MICGDCSNCQRRVGWVGLIVSVLVGAFTISVGLLTGSKALIAASLCVGLDVVTGLTVVYGLNLSERPIDIEHPYGHGKVEFLVVTGISLFLMTTAAILFWDSLKSIYHGDPGPDQMLTLITALLAAAVHELKYRYIRCVSEHSKRPAIKSHADHSRVDAISCAAVVVGVMSAWIGLHFVDPLIAIFEVTHITRASIIMLKESVTGLMDVTLPIQESDRIRDGVAAVEGVRGVNYLHARQLGEQVWIELSFNTAPGITVFEGRCIADSVKAHLFHRVDNIGNVQVHFRSEAA